MLGTYPQSRPDAVRSSPAGRVACTRTYGCVDVSVSASGTVTGTKVTQSSGDIEFDRAAMKAAQKIGKLKNWWSCRGAAPRVRKAGPKLSPGSASIFTYSNVLLKAWITVRSRLCFLHGLRVGRPCQPEFVTGERRSSGRLFTSGGYLIKQPVRIGYLRVKRLRSF